MTTSDQAPRDLIGFLDFYLVKKAPFQLPAEVKEFFVKFGPWILGAILGGLIGLYILFQIRPLYVH